MWYSHFRNVYFRSDVLRSITSQVFLWLDTDRDLVLTKAEAQAALASIKETSGHDLGGLGLSIFEEDQEEASRAQVEERLLNLLDAKDSVDTFTRLVAIFQHFDEDNSGNLSVEEITELLHVADVVSALVD